MTLKFIGFADSDKFIEAVDRSRPVDLTIGRKSGKPDKRFGIAGDSSVLTMSQVQGDEALYFECITYRWTVSNGQSFEIDQDKPRRLADQAFEAAKRYLTDHNIKYREALLAMPISYVKMNGEPTFLKWDKASESYLYYSAEPAKQA